jgi:hypothetical protein
MNPIVSALVKWLIIVGIGVITFMPTYGLIAINIQYFVSTPLALITLDLLWLILIAVILPFSLNIFRWISLVLVLGLIGCVIFSIWQFLPGVFSAIPWFMWVVIGGFGGIGWLLIATPLWRWLHRTLPVDTQ